MKTYVSLSLVGICTVYAQTYHLRKEDIYDKSNYLEKFTFRDSDDMGMSHGSVRWKDKAYALENGLASKTEFRVGAGREILEGKRASVKLEGISTYNSPSLFVFDVKHMPEAGCGSWPALWTTGKTPEGTSDWPRFGEIDIIEGVNFMEQNRYTLHSERSGECTLDRDQSQTGTPVNGNNCGVRDGNRNIVNPVGCSVDSSQRDTIFKDFNARGGGIVVMEWTHKFIRFWFKRRARILPSSNVTTAFTGSRNILSEQMVGLLGKPDGVFSGNCDFAEKFARQFLIISTNFCGDWAAEGSVWKGVEAQCGPSCDATVTDPGYRYHDKYWEFNRIAVFTEY